MLRQIQWYAATVATEWEEQPMQVTKNTWRMLPFCRFFALNMTAVATQQCCNGGNGTYATVHKLGHIKDNRDSTVVAYPCKYLYWKQAFRNKFALYNPRSVWDYLSMRLENGLKQGLCKLLRGNSTLSQVKLLPLLIINILLLRCICFLYYIWWH